MDVKAEAAERVKEMGKWLIDHADIVTAGMDESMVAKNGLVVNSTIRLDGIGSVHVTKNYLLINR